MRNLALAIGLAVLAAVAAVGADAPDPSLATSPPSAQRFSIDLDPSFFPANTATSLGTVEPSARADNDGVINFDEDFVDTVQVDITVTGIPSSNAMIGYQYTLNYNPTAAEITYREPKLGLVDPDSISGGTSDPLPDTDGAYHVDFIDPSGAAGAEYGNGVLDTLRIEAIGASYTVTPLTLTNAAHIDTVGSVWVPDAIDNGAFGVNGSIGSPADLKTLSQTVTFPAQVDPNTDVQMDVDKVVHNNGPWHPNTDAETTLTPPPGCTVNGGSGPVTLNTALGILIAGTTVPNQHSVTVRCSALGAYILPVTGCAILDDVSKIDPISGNNCITTNVAFQVTAQADGGILGGNISYPSTITADTQFPITVQTSWSNTGPYTPADFTLTNSASPPSGCSVTPPSSSTHSLAAAPTPVSETWYINCAVGGPHTISLNLVLASASAYVIDPNLGNNGAFAVLSLRAERDADRDGVWDLDETPCGVASFGVAYRTERVNGFDDDADGQTDEVLPPGSEASDCDGDGYSGAAEAHVFEAAGRDQRDCGTANWPADFVSGGIPVSTDKVTITDLTSFLAPTRHIGTNVGDNPGNVRWDLAPGKGLFTTDINIQDLTSLVASSPSMFGGNRAFNGLTCGSVGCSDSDACCPVDATMGLRFCLTSNRLIFHSGDVVSLKLAVTNMSPGIVVLSFTGTCPTDTTTFAIATGTTWDSSTAETCTPVTATYNLLPGQTQNFTPESGPTGANGDYRVAVELNALGCGTVSSPCVAPECPLAICLSPVQPGFAIRRVP